MNSSGNLLHNCVLFGRLLRGLGMEVTPAQLLDVVESLQYISIGSRQDFKAGLAALLVKRRQQQAVFDAAFEAFWQAPPSENVKELDLGSLARRRRRQGQPQLAHAAADAPADQESGEQPEPYLDKIQTYSEIEILRQRDFAALDADELAAVRKLLNAIAWELPPRRTRRKEPVARRGLFDMRRTLRQNLRHGGEVIRLAHRAPRAKPRPVVVLCDISGSMERYSRILLQFLYGVSARLGRVESFVFSTRLTRITRQLHYRDVDLALAEASRAVHDWAGGTRIGEAIKTFNYGWARRVLNQGAVVLIISDGWDRGDISLLDNEMARLHRSAYRVIWLNPLLGETGYQPLVRGMQAALPHIDLFLPVHNLASLEQLARVLREMRSEGRGARGEKGLADRGGEYARIVGGGGAVAR